VNVDGLRLIACLEMELLGVAGFHRTGKRASVVQGDDIGEEAASRPEDQQENASHTLTL